ncbi:MAG TPA: hypothetical protein VIV40_37720 [Kofleriaceae bacterium]
MIERWCLLGLVVLGACQPPPMRLRFKLTDGDAYKCIGDTGTETTDCSDISLACKGVLSVRVVKPSDPEIPFAYVCKQLSGAQNKLCSIAGVDLPLPSKPIEEQVLEIQMAVFQKDELESDADGNPICPRVDFAADGFPKPNVTCSETDPGGCPARPAVAGRAFYYPGDEETVVELGCTDPSRLNAPECTGATSISVTTAINDFDTTVSVGPIVADRLTVSLGEPRLNASGFYDLTPTFTRPLARVGVGTTWSGEIVDLELQNTYCIEVFEDVAQATRSLTCRSLAPLPKPITRLDGSGIRLDKNTLAGILTAIGTTSFPDQGLVVGVVLSPTTGAPVAGATVTPSCAPGCTIKYLGTDRKSLVVGTQVTSSNGIFISTDAPYPATFGGPGGTMELGGLVEGKVTIVVLQGSMTTGM